MLRNNNVNLSKDLGRTGFSPGWQGCSLGFPSGFTLEKSLSGALPVLGKLRCSLLFDLDYPNVEAFTAILRPFPTLKALQQFRGISFHYQGDQ